MATVETHWFTKGGKNLIEAEIGWVTGPINVMLLHAGYVFDQDGPETYADVSGAEAAGAGYVAGGVVIPNRTVVIDPANNDTQLQGDQVQWNPSSITARGAVIYATGGAKPVLGYVDFTTDRTSENGIFRIQWPPTGVLRTRAL